VCPPSQSEYLAAYPSRKRWAAMGTGVTPTGRGCARRATSPAGVSAMPAYHSTKAGGAKMARSMREASWRTSTSRCTEIN